jgi:hypothetical protein
MRWSERLAALALTFHEIPPSTRSHALFRQPSLIYSRWAYEDAIRDDLALAAVFSCGAGRERGESWSEGESYTPMPGQQHPPFEVVGWGSDGAHLYGLFIYTLSRHPDDPPVGIVRGVSDGDWFRPNVTLQVSESWNGPWRTVGTLELGRELLTIEASKGHAGLRVALDAFKPYVATLRCGRIVLDSSETATIGLKGLILPSQRRGGDE